jgi:hypothetical protein
MPKHDDTTEPIPKTAVRIRNARLWIDGAKEVADQIDDKHVHHLYEDYLADAGIGQFEEKGLRWLAGSKQPKVVLVPIFAQENITSPTIDRFQQVGGSEIAAYHRARPGNIMFSGEVSMTPVWKGIVLLHEAAHADADYEVKYPSDDHWKEEVDVFRLEHRWMRLIGGEGYIKFIASEVTRFLEEYDDHGGRGGSIPPLLHGPQLDLSFSPALSNEETATRRTAAWFDVCFQMFEQKYGAVQGRRDMIGLTKGFYGD